MSVARDIKDFVLGKPTTPKVAAPPVAPPAPPPPPAFLSAHIKPDTKEFLIVFGAYNFTVAKSFAQPVVGLLNDWVPAYATMPPFAGMQRAEIVISRVSPESNSMAQDCDPEATKAAVSSANIDTNIRVLISLARHGWIRERCILSTGGVFTKAQQRFDSRHFPTHREKYIQQFVPLPFRPRDIAALCAPPAPQRPVVAPVLLPARQVCKNQAHWDALPEVEQARMLAGEAPQWMNRYTSAWGNSSRSYRDMGIPAPPPSFDERTDTDGWKQPPNASERESIERDDWK
jgi:hypothetical protein